jgi:hypothetical protein
MGIVLTCDGISTPSGIVKIVVEILMASVAWDHDDSETKIEDNSMIAFIYAERKAHPPLGAGTEVSHWVEVLVTGKLVNRTAPSGWMMRLVGLIFY